MKRLDVYYAGWSEDWLLGSLADDGSALLFEYSRQALERGLELSPLMLKLAPKTYDRFPPHFYRLPGLVADSLPDGWGLLLMDRLFRQQGIRHPGPLDRLAFIGDRAMGALRFVPAHQDGDVAFDWNLSTLAEKTTQFLHDDANTALRELAGIGGSPQGARPKALVHYHPDHGDITTCAQGLGEPWLVKFPAQAEHKEVCALEQLYAELARDCSIDMPPSRWFDIDANMAAFGVARFDRFDGQRVPYHSLAGLLQIDFRVPGAVDYTGFLRATRFLTRDESQVQKAFERAVFNVVFHNRDDHPKNFAWCLGQDDRWRLAPAFDLTFSDGPMGQHHMDICGQATDIGREHLMQLAKESAVPESVAGQTIDFMLEQAAGFKKRTREFPIRKVTVDQVTEVVKACAQRLKA
ncbi:type II toxin-antitoxin system HipA family toxin [Orrella daihaiensis]|uniref:Type II toxin-antitoxin system HipA family toxin n=1 Tax=Orrella daihaiensis TaxID=2782176 RepID=A0ABY4AMK9_9BURK|nr:type II toxin-antitoxin system HipA family toxin [Orrella daihaiensis]UOD51278.1 type II toxin-antitoxin system HipA family toxin [Orrella daihaiensis]